MVRLPIGTGTQRDDEEEELLVSKHKELNNKNTCKHNGRVTPS
jgi:hypothetical protein